VTIAPVPIGAAPELSFAVLDAAPVEYGAAPALRFPVRLRSGDARPIRSVLLDVQVQIAARRRRYEPEAQMRLSELFGPSRDWGTTLRTLLWARTTLTVAPFVGETVADLLVPCSYDLDVAASRYLDALPGGEVPLEFLFTGTVFYAAADGRLQTARLQWDREAEYRLPVSAWRAALEQHFRGTAWLRVRKDRFDRLAAFRARRALAGWDEVIDALLPEDAP
jgi:hypothetical protein